jgi:hypothetical protein
LLVYIHIIFGKILITDLCDTEFFKLRLSILSREIYLVLANYFR